MTIETLLGVILFAFVVSITPGPNNAMLLASGVNFGFRPTIPHLLGVDLGFAVMLIAVGLGIGSVFAAVPILHTVLRYAGTAYLLYLAWRIARSGAPGAGDARSRPMSFLQAALFQWVNPKGWLAALGAIATYTPAQGFFANLLTVTAVYALVMAPCICIWTVLGTALRRFLGDPRWMRAFNVAMALLLVASLYPTLAESPRALPWR